MMCYSIWQLCQIFTQSINAIDKSVTPSRWTVSIQLMSQDADWMSNIKCQMLNAKFEFQMSNVRFHSLMSKSNVKCQLGETFVGAYLQNSSGPFTFITVDNKYVSDHFRQEWQTRHLFFQEMHVVKLLLFSTTEPGRLVQTWCGSKFEIRQLS